MIKRTFTIVFCALCLAACVTSASAQKSTGIHINFPRGKTSATVRGQWQGDGVKYLFKARIGQRATIFVEGDVSMSVETDGECDGGTCQVTQETKQWTGRIKGPVTSYPDENKQNERGVATYYIFVYSGKKFRRPIPFALSVKIE